MLKHTEIEFDVEHEQFYMCDNQDIVDWKLYFAELDVWNGVKGFKCDEEDWVQEKREELGL